MQCQHFFYRLNVIVTEMFVISYDLSCFSSMKNSHILLLVQIMVHIIHVIKMLMSSKLLTSSENIFCWIFWVVSYITELFDFFWRRWQYTLLFLISLSICHQTILGELNNRKCKVIYMHITLYYFVYDKETMHKVIIWVQDVCVNISTCHL